MAVSNPILSTVMLRSAIPNDVFHYKCQLLSGQYLLCVYSPNKKEEEEYRWMDGLKPSNLYQPNCNVKDGQTDSCYWQHSRGCLVVPSLLWSLLFCFISIYYFCSKLRGPGFLWDGKKRRESHWLHFPADGMFATSGWEQRHECYSLSAMPRCSVRAQPNPI